MLPKEATDLHPPWGDGKLVVRAVGMPHEACKKTSFDKVLDLTAQ